MRQDVKNAKNAKDNASHPAFLGAFLGDSLRLCASNWLSGLLNPEERQRMADLARVFLYRVAADVRPAGDAVDVGTLWGRERSSSSCKSTYLPGSGITGDLDSFTHHPAVIVNQVLGHRIEERFIAYRPAHQGREREPDSSPIVPFSVTSCRPTAKG